MAGTKHDKAKLRWVLLPWEPLREVVKVLEFGAGKYKPNNWKKLSNFKVRFTNALIRHTVQYILDENDGFDEETNIHHLAHMACNCLFLLWYEMRSKKYATHKRRTALPVSH